MASKRREPHTATQVMQTLLLGGILLVSALLAIGQAQMTLDGSLGPGGPLTGPNYRIGADAGQIRGSNLFHSFGEFNVPAEGSATFTGPHTIANILSRVTGGQPSAIDGVLRSEIVGANLFLLNPSGVLFGPNARLDVSGSFHASTADVLRFADGAQFSTHLGQASVLTVAEPAAFGFLSANPAAISLRGGSLQAPTGQALSLVGGEVTIVGGPATSRSAPSLGAPSGRIQLASVASPGDVRFSPLELAPDLQVDAFARLGAVALSQGARVDASGNGAGTVLLRGGRLRVDRALIFADNRGAMHGTGLGVDLRVTAEAVITDGSFITTDSLGAGRARDLLLIANSVHLDASSIGSVPSASGDGGNVTVQVGRLTLAGGAVINSSTAPNSGGRGGQLTVTATEAIAIAGRNSRGTPSGLFSNTFGRGDAGRLSVSTPLLTMDEGLIQAAAAEGSGGNAGSIEVSGGRLTLTGGAQIDSSTRSLGRGGELAVAVTEAVEIAGFNSRGNPSGLFSTTFGRGNAGRLSVSAPTVTMAGGRIQARSFGDGNAGDISLEVERLTLTEGAQISSTTAGNGRGGQLTVTAAETIAIAGRDSAGNPSGLFSATQRSGQGSDLRIAAPQIQLRDGGTISASSTGDGAAGTILVQVGDTFLSENGRVTTAADRAGGGAITITAGRLVQLIEGSRNFTRGVSCGKMRLSLAERRAPWLPPTPPARFPPHGSARPVTIF